ncbi:sulfite exporter TauE/SafE family protein [Achromobacter aloeverae]
MSTAVLLAWASAIVFVAGIVRGLTGFGFAALSVVGLAFLLPVREAVPAVLCLEVCASLALLPKCWRRVDWRLSRPLLLAALCGVPAGLFGLTRVDGHAMTLAVYVLIGALAVLGLARVRLPVSGGPSGAWVVGGATGALLAAFSVGGPLVAAWMAHAGTKADRMRATLVLFFGAIDLASVAAMAATGNLGAQTPLRVALLLPCTYAGLWIGEYLFSRVSAERVVAYVQWLLLALALMGLYSVLAA